MNPPSAAALSTLVERIAGVADAAGRWTITPDEVARLVGVDPVTFWREANGLRHRISFGEAIDGFTQDTVGDLVTVLERLVGDGVEGAFVRAGLFVSHERGVELTAQLLHASRRFSALHDIRADDLAGMIRHARSVRGAIDLYLGEHADLESLIHECAESFAGMEGLPLLAGSTAERYLRRMVEKHVLEPRGLFTLLEGRLRTAAAGLGFVDPEDREGADASARGARREAPPERSVSRRAWALHVMGFEGHGSGLHGSSMPDAETLRGRYRQLMMRHHPDVDPSGLERCKDVNVAYGLLIAEAADA
jgi:hypothetical protein